MSLQTTPARAWKWAHGLIKRICEHNDGIPLGKVSGLRYINDPTVGNSPDEEGYPFFVWQTWEDKREASRLLRGVIEQRNEEYPDFDSRVDEGFSDEYEECCEDGCMNIVRTSPDCYFWTPSYVQSEYGKTCEECWKKSPEFVIETYKNEARGIPADFNPGAHGWTKVNDDHWQNGMFPGMNDNPEAQLDALQKAGIDAMFEVFPSQFYVEWDLWVEDENVKRARNVLGIDGLPPAENEVEENV